MRLEMISQTYRDAGEVCRRVTDVELVRFWCECNVMRCDRWEVADKRLQAGGC
jgi:hypothetical protein